MAAPSLKLEPMTRLLACVGLAATTAACYHAESLDEHALLEELRNPPPLTAAERRGAPAVQLGQLGEDDAVAVALVRNPELRAFRRKRQVAEGAIVAASAIPNPWLRLEALHLQGMGDGTGGLGLALQWSPPQPTVWSAQRKRAQAGLQEVEQEIVEREWLVATEVRAVCARLRSIEEQRRLIDGTMQRRQRIVELVKQRIQAGGSTRLELNLASLGVTQVERERDDLEAQRVVLARALQGLLGGGEVGLAPQPGALGEGPVPSTPAVAALEDQALTARPALRAAKARFLQREQAVRREYAQRWPWIQLSAAPRYRYNSSSKYQNDVMLGVDVSLPVFNWNRGGIMVAEAERAEERERTLALLASMRQEIAGAHARLEVQRATLERYRLKVLPALAEHERLLTLAIQGGQVDLVALLQGEDVVLRNRRAYLELLVEHRRAWLALERTVGGRVAAAGGSSPGTGK